MPSLKTWMEQLGGLPFPLLSDYWPHGTVGKAYGVFNDEAGFANRGTFVIDRAGRVAVVLVGATTQSQLNAVLARVR